MKNALFLLFALLMTACGTTSNSETASTTKEDATTSNNNFGELIDETGVIQLADLASKFQDTDSVNVKLTGTVESVCQAKGCWMNIVSKDAPGEEIFVKFKDYGFFMPKDIAGRKVIMDGYAFKELTPVDELRHYAEDAGKSADEIAAITEPLEELKFMASGVILLEE